MLSPSLNPSHVLNDSLKVVLNLDLNFCVHSKLTILRLIVVYKNPLTNQAAELDSARHIMADNISFNNNSSSSNINFYEFLTNFLTMINIKQLKLVGSLFYS